jgi:hypothetical protein
MKKSTTKVYKKWNCWESSFVLSSLLKVDRDAQNQRGWKYVSIYINDFILSRLEKDGNIYDARDWKYCKKIFILTLYIYIEAGEESPQEAPFWLSDSQKKPESAARGKRDKVINLDNLEVWTALFVKRRGIQEQRYNIYIYISLEMEKKA